MLSCTREALRVFVSSWLHFYVVLVHEIAKSIVRADERQEPRPAVVERDRREQVVEERMLDRFAGHAPRHELAQIGRHRDAVSAVAAGEIHAVQLTRTRHLVAREGDVPAPRVLDGFGRKLREDFHEAAPENRGGAPRRLGPGTAEL